MEKSKNKCKVEQLHSSVCCKDGKPVSLNKNKQFVSTVSSPPVGLPPWESCRKAKGGTFVCLVNKQGWGAPNKHPSRGWVIIGSACAWEQRRWVSLRVPPHARGGGASGEPVVQRAASAQRDMREKGQDVAMSPGTVTRAKPWHCCNVTDFFVLSSFKYITKCFTRGSLAWN